MSKAKATKRSPVREDARPEPPMDPRMGDKTPAWMQWLRDTHPEDFKKRYQNRKTAHTNHD